MSSDSAAGAFWARSAPARGPAALNPGAAVVAPGPAAAAHRPGGVRAERFGRIFRLPPFAQHSPRVEPALRELGTPGGPLDARDPLAAELIVDPALSANNPNNPDHTADSLAPRHP
jgi:hypothetical protein